MSGSGTRRKCAERWVTPEFTVDDDTLVVAQTFRLVKN